MAKLLFIFFFIIFFFINLPLSLSQLTAVESCNGIFLSYNYTSGYRIPPTLVPLDPAHQPYRFQSILTIINNGLQELKSWRVYVGFEHGEVLVSASNAVLDDGRLLPADVGNGTVFVGFPARDLKTAVETAGDMSQMGAQVQLVGTQFGVADPDVPLPSTITLANDGFSCPNPTNLDSWMHLCCTEDPTRRSNFTRGEDLQPLQNGDVTIMYDVIRSYDTNYWTQITVSNHNPLHRLENWKLSWEWKRDEFIYAMKGAYPSLIDTADCIFGKQGEHYKEIDFSNTLNCERMPTIIDLPPTMANNSDLGMIPFCCRNGTILSPAMDESKSVSGFQMQVFKMPAEFNKTELIPPQNWKIRGVVNQDYQCAPPVRVRRSRFPDPTGLSSDSTAIASWQVVCNKTESKGANPRCCVSFSSFLNDSIVPCKTCACGCKISPSSTCSASAPALLLPSEALLVPFENRTRKATEFAKLHQLPLPKPLPCGDNCGVNINWHLHTDYENGWTARITLFNWDETDIVDWFAALQFEKAVPGFQTMYSFNGSALPGLPAQNTIFMQGKPGLNYLLAEKDGKNPKRNPRVPGTQQSLIIFTKKTTPGIKVAGRDGFPTKVFFNGEECSLPSILPSNAYRMSEAARFFGFFLTVVVLLCLQH